MCHEFEVKGVSNRHFGLTGGSIQLSALFTIILLSKVFPKRDINIYVVVKCYLSLHLLD